MADSLEYGRVRVRYILVPATGSAQGVRMPYRVTFLVMIVSLALGCELAADKRVAHLEQELMQVKNALNEAEFKVQQSQVSIEMLTRQLVRVKVERDKLKQELATLAKAQ
ncbi:MAG: hypothetical protein E2O37_00760 [Proteobacteria bacterium]|nr:MAG: hypothetical protein E2O37_00760 [Pseudomonadota bacterium]TDJ71987.1 MAG: hypothetical protein E2O38_06175 [Pseudomonadota bacterium]